MRTLCCAATLLFASGLNAATHYRFTPGSPRIRSESTAICTPGAVEFTTNVGVQGDVRINRIRVDTAGNAYVAGARLDLESADAFVAKVDSSGCLVFSVTIGGSGGEMVHDVAVDALGRIYLGGSTSSSDFPLRNAAVSTPFTQWLGAGFIVRLSADGGELLGSTYLDGPVNAVALDADASIYATGATFYSDFRNDLPRASTLPRTGLSAVQAAYVVKLAPGADRVLFSGYVTGSTKACGAGSTCFLSTRLTSGVAIAVDRDRNIIIGGNSEVSNLPVTDGALRREGVGAFVAKINTETRSLVYLTYLGARADPVSPSAGVGNVLRDLTLDAAGNVVIVGRTIDENFPATAGVVQPTIPSGVVPRGNFDNDWDAFAAKLNPQGSAMVWATYLGSAAEVEDMRAVSVDASGNVWASGATQSGSDFLLGLNPNASAIVESRRFTAGWMQMSVVARGRIYTATESGAVSAFRLGNASPEPRILLVTNAANLTPGIAIAPGEIVSLYGAALGSADRIKLFFNDVPAMVLYASPGQINAIVPGTLPVGVSVTIRVQDGTTDMLFPARSVAAMPEIFRLRSGADAVAAVNEDGTRNTAANPAKRGSVVSLWATGTGLSSFPDGTIATRARYIACCAVFINGAGAELLYSGHAPGMLTAITQLNVRLPSSSYSDALSVVVQAGERTSSPVTVYMKAENE